jgi:hypothetical protein
VGPLCSLGLGEQRRRSQPHTVGADAFSRTLNCCLCGKQRAEAIMIDVT